MSFEFNWEHVGGEVNSRIQQQLQIALTDALKQNAPLNSYVHGLEVESFSLGDVPPFVEILTIENGMDSLPSDDVQSEGHSTRLSHVSDLSPVKKCDYVETPSRNVSAPPSPVTPMGEMTPECSNKSSDVTACEGSPGIHETLRYWTDPDGLFLRIRCSYGGNMHCKVRCVFNYSSTIHDKLTVGISLPISCVVRRLNVNCNFLCNVKDGIITASIEKKPRFLPSNFSELSSKSANSEPSPVGASDCSHTLQFDLIVSVGARSTQETTVEEDKSTRWSTTSEKSGINPFRLATFRSTYDSVRSLLLNREISIMEKIKLLFQRSLENLQRIPTAMQLSIMNGLDSCIRVRHQYTGECIDERVVAAFVRDRLNLWLEENLIQPNYIRVPA